jgi:hypothetical protein
VGCRVEEAEIPHLQPAELLDENKKVVRRQVFRHGRLLMTGLSSQGSFIAEFVTAPTDQRAREAAAYPWWDGAAYRGEYWT